MKLLIMSDMHKRVSNFERAVERETQAKNVIFLGDGLSKAEELSFIYSDRNFYMVAGNCDGFFSFEPTTKIITLNGYKILITHGHAYSVKSSLTALKQRAVSEGVQIALYGHTHIADIKNENGIWFVNPGALLNNSYAVIDIKDDKIIPKIALL